VKSAQYDERLWFLHRGCTGRHFLLGNPHTFPGRIYGWCGIKKRSFFFSKSEIEEASPEAIIWIEGFLAGNEPEPPKNSEGEVDFESHEYKLWLHMVEVFRQSGAWSKDCE
jgi:hypothetical protein